MGTRMLLALSQQLSPAPTQRPCVQLLGKVPVPFRQVLGTLCSCPIAALGTSCPTGLQEEVAHGARHSQKHFGVSPVGPLQNSSPMAGRRGG